MFKTNLNQYVDLVGSHVEDRRETHGEVVKIPIREEIGPIKAVEAVANELAKFMQQKMGRGYELALEVGQPNEVIVREPGHGYYGLKVFAEGRFIYISRVAILEDETILKQYVDHLRLLLVEEADS